MNNLKVVSYGPWSTLFKTVEPPIAATTIALTDTVSRSRGSDVVISDLAGGPSNEAHELAPAFSWTGSLSLAPGLYGACPGLGVDCPCSTSTSTRMRTAYRVHVSDLIGSPAYMCRASPGHSDPVRPRRAGWSLRCLPPTPRPRAGSSHDASAATWSQPLGLEVGVETDPTAARSRPRTGLENWFRDMDWPDGRYYWTRRADGHLFDSRQHDRVPRRRVRGGHVCGRRSPALRQDQRARNRARVGCPVHLGHVQIYGKLQRHDGDPVLRTRCCRVGSRRSARKNQAERSLRASPWKTVGSGQDAGHWAALLDPRA